MLQKLLSKFKVSTKLYFLVFILCSTIIAIAGYGLFQMNRMDKSTNDLYENRVVCMEQLVNVRHAYAKNIVFALQELKDGTISYHEAGKRMDAAYAEIGTNWQAYKQTYLIPDEIKLVTEAEMMMHQADSAITVERALLGKSDTTNFSDVRPVKLFNITYALVEKLNELLRLQVRVSKEIIETGNREYKTTVRNFYILIGSVLALGILVFFAILFDTNNLVKNLETSNKNLSENEEKLRTFIENAGDAIIMFDESLNITLANNYGCNMLGYSRGELLTMRSMDIMAPADREKHTAKLTELKSGAGSVHERKFLRKDGSIVETEVNVQALKGTGYIAIIRDITERKRVQDETKKREAEFKAFFDNIESASCLLDIDKKYVIFNKRFIEDHKRLTGTEPKVGQLVYDLFPPEVQAERHRIIDKVLQSATHEKIEIDVDYLRDGRRYYYRTAFNPVITDGKVIGVTTVSIDLSSIKEAEQKFRDLVEKSLTGVYIYDYEKFAYVNPRLTEIFGYTEEELFTMNPVSVIHEDDLQAVMENLRQRQEDIVNSFHYTARARKKDGTIIWIEVMGTATTYNGKKASIGTILDITEIKKAELDLKKTEEKNRAVIENISDAIFLMDEKTISYYHSPSVQKIFGYTFEETRGDTVFKYIHPDEIEQARMFFSEIIRNPGITLQNQFRVLHKNGSHLWVEGTATNLLNNESVKAIILNCRDVTERKNSDMVIESLNESLEKKVIERTAQLKESEERLKNTSRFLDTVLENIPDMVFVKDAELKYLLMNKAGENLLGWKKEELIGKTYYDIIPEKTAQEYTLADQKLLNSGEFLDIEEERLANDRQVQVHTRKFVIKGDDGTPQYIIGITRDISLKKAQEEKIKTLNAELEQNVLQLKASNKELESFSYSVSHDLRTPLTIIHGYVQVLLQEEGKFDEDTSNMMKAVMENAERMADLIDDILALSTAVKTEAKIAKLDMTEIAKSAYTELEKSLHGSVKANTTFNPLLPCYGDHNLITQVFTNLISNAIKYSGQKEQPEIEVGSYKKNNECIYYVKDNGAGFDMKNYDKLFGVFQRLHSSREFEGTGVGLALVKRIITKHNGRVWAEAEPGKGATFYFSTPASA